MQLQSSCLNYILTHEIHISMNTSHEQRNIKFQINISKIQLKKIICLDL